MTSTASEPLCARFHARLDMEPQSSFGVIGDIHGNGALLARALLEYRVSQVEFILCVGDIGADIHLDSQGADGSLLDAWVSQTQSVVDTLVVAEKPICYVLGNHDDISLWQTHISPKPGLHNIDSCCMGEPYVGETMRVFGIGGSTKTPERWPNEWARDSTRVGSPLRRIWGGTGRRILAAHCPPKGTYLDIESHRTAHIGSKAIRAIVNDLQPTPRLCVCGHVHEGRGVDLVDGVPWLNAGCLETSQPLPHDPLGGSLYGASCFYVHLLSTSIEIVELFAPASWSLPVVAAGRYVIKDGAIEHVAGLRCVTLDSTDASAPRLAKYTEILPRGLRRKRLATLGRESDLPAKELPDV